MFGWFQRLLPKSGDFFGMFERHAAACVDAADALARLTRAQGDAAQWVGRIRDREHAADDVIREVPLDKERFTIGRKPHNDIQIDNLAVSGEHALIVTILNDSFLEDLGSTNGTLVNGNPVKKHILQTNDVVEIGKYKLKYVNDANSGQATVQDFEKTMVLRAPMAKSMGASPAGSFGGQSPRCRLWSRCRQR